MELALRLAGQEAGAAGFGEIEPEHMGMGLLKLAEMDLESLARGKSEDSATQVMLGEVQGIQGFLQRCGVDSTLARRELRRLRGRGRAPSDGARLLRSASSHRIYEQAERLAVASGAQSVGAGHLLRALMEAAVPLVVRVLGEGPKRSPSAGPEVSAPPPPPSPSEALDVHGVKGRSEPLRPSGKKRSGLALVPAVRPAEDHARGLEEPDVPVAGPAGGEEHRVAPRARDKAAIVAPPPGGRARELRALVLEGAQGPLAPRPAEGRALSQVLAEPTRPSVALVCAADGVALAAVAEAARILGDARVLPGAKSRQFCVLEPEAVETLDQLWDDFATHRELVVVLPPLAQMDAASRQVLRLLAQGTVQAVLRVDPDLFHGGLRRDPLFRKAVHAMRLQDEVAHEVPWSL